MQNLLRSTRTVLLGMAVSQAIPILGSLIITRLYAPDSFGVFAAWVGMVYVAAILITGRFEMAFAIVKDESARQAGVVATLLTATISALALILIVAAVTFIWPQLLPNIPAPLVWSFIPAAFFTALTQIWQNWAAANGAYKTLSAMRIWLALTVTALQIIVGYFAPTATALAYAYLLGTLFGALASFKLLPLELKPSNSVSTTTQQIRLFFKQQKQFPKFALPAGVISSATAQIPIILIAGKFGVEASGLYALATRVLGAPIGLLGKAVLDVFKRTAAQEFEENGHCRRTYRDTFFILSLCAIALALGVAFLAEPAFGWLFGQNWREAGTIAIWLMPLFALRFIASPLSYMFFIAEKQKVELLWQCVLLLITVLSFIATQSFKQAIFFYVAGYGFLYIIYLALSFHYSKGQNQRNITEH